MILMTTILITILKIINGNNYNGNDRNGNDHKDYNNDSVTIPVISKNGIATIIRVLLTLKFSLI